MKKLIIILLALIIAAGCSFPDMYDYEPQIVVEGWIEDGGYPVVIVTSTVPVTGDYRYWDEMQDHIIRWAKVTVSDGTWREGHFVKGEHISGRARTVDKYGTVYIGDIRDGRYHGKGKCIYADKTWFEGNFEDGVRKDGVYYNADGVKIKDVK
jgi:hypothetical protein